MGTFDGESRAFAGGPPVLLVPGSGDQVTVDENSFDGVGSDMISLTQDASCTALLWTNSKPSGISLHNNSLSFDRQFIIASANFSIETQGTIRLLSATTGNFFAKNCNLTGATLEFDGGTWNLKGNITADELQFNAGTLNISGSNLLLARLVTQTGSAKEFSARVAAQFF